MSKETETETTTVESAAAATTTTTTTTSESESERPVRKYRCYICNAEFSGKEAFKEHAQTVTHSSSRAVVLQLPFSITSERFLEVARAHEAGVSQAWVKKYRKFIGRQGAAAATTATSSANSPKRRRTIQMIIGYVIFPDDVTRDRFVESLDGKEVDGHTVRVESIVKGPTIVVTGISDETDEKSTKEHFAEFNPIKTSIKLFHGRRSARVTFSSAEDRDAALERCSKTLDGKEVKLKAWRSRFELKANDKKKAETAAETTTTAAVATTKTAVKEKSKEKPKEKKVDKEKKQSNSKRRMRREKARTKGITVVKEEKPTSYSVKLTNLPNEVDADNIGDIFEGHEVLDKTINKEDHSATLTFSTEEAAKNAAQDINGIIVNDITISATYVKPKRFLTIKRVTEIKAPKKIVVTRPSSSSSSSSQPQPQQAETPETTEKMTFKLHAGNLDFSVGSAQLKETFHAYNCKYARVFRSTTGRSYGHGVVTFENEADMNAAFKAVDGKNVSGRPVKLTVYDFGKKRRHEKTTPGTAAETKESNDEITITVKRAQALGTKKPPKKEEENSDSDDNENETLTAEKKESKLHLSMLPKDTEKKELEKFLASFNPVSVTVQVSRKGIHSFAVAEFANEKDMNDAMDFLQKTPFKSTKVKVGRELAKRKP